MDTDERRRFAQVSHEYLIEQLQFTGIETLTSTSNKIRLNFNHPVKELVWVARRDVSETANEWTNFTDATGFAGGDPLVDAKLQLNGHDRFSTRVARYFNLVQPFQHHTNIPVTGIYVYSFGLKPEEHQPSGTANLSRIDNATFLMTFAAALFTGNATVSLLIYATNYNVLRIMSGMGGLNKTGQKSSFLLAMWIRQHPKEFVFHNFQNNNSTAASTIRSARHLIMFRETPESFCYHLLYRNVQSQGPRLMAVLNGNNAKDLGDPRVKNLNIAKFYLWVRCMVLPQRPHGCR